MYVVTDYNVLLVPKWKILIFLIHSMSKLLYSNSNSTFPSTWLRSTTTQFSKHFQKLSRSSSHNFPPWRTSWMCSYQILKLKKPFCSMWYPRFMWPLTVHQWTCNLTSCVVIWSTLSLMFLVSMVLEMRCCDGQRVTYIFSELVLVRINFYQQSFTICHYKTAGKLRQNAVDQWLSGLNRIV